MVGGQFPAIVPRTLTTGIAVNFASHQISERDIICLNGSMEIWYMCIMTDKIIFKQV